MKTSCRSIGVQPLNAWFPVTQCFLGLLLAVFSSLTAVQAQSNFVTPYAFTTFAGRAASGDADGTGSGARFRAPQAAAVDASGNVYVADSMSNTIRKITAGGVVTTFAGSAGLSGSVDGTGSAARFSYPSGVAVDGSGNVYVADDYNSTIRKITSGGVVTTFAGTAGSIGSADGLGTAAQFGYPRSVAIDGSGNVYVADTGNSTIRKITPAGLVSTFAGTAGIYDSLDATGSAAQFNFPCGVAADNLNNIYVADANNHTIRKITPAGVVTTFAGLAGSPGTADGNGSAARFWNPLAVAVDSIGNVYVAGGSGIRRITAAGAVTTYSDASGTKGWNAGTGTPVEFNYAEGVAVDSTGAIYVAALFNYSIRKISADGATLTTLAGISSSAGFANGTGSAAQFDWPAGVAVDGTGNLYIADHNNSTIRKISSGGVVTTLAGAAGSPGSTNATGTAAQFNAPFGVAVDGAGNVYVSDTNNQAVRKITPAAVVTTLATLSSPLGIAVDGSGNLYTTDVDNTVSKISAEGAVTTLAGLAGSTGSNDGTGTAARFNQPLGIALDGEGNVYVSDNQNSTIRKITPAGVVTTFAGIAGGERTVTDGTGSNARFADPVGMAVDSVGNIFVVDNGDEMIRKISPAGVVTSLAGGGWGSRDGTGSAAQFCNMYGIAVDGSGVLWVADPVNNTIRKGILAPPILTSATTGSGDLNQSFNYTATFSGEPTSYSASGLPGGLSCNVATGVISGVPTSAGNFAVTLGATNGAGTGTATFTLTIAKGNQTISFGALADKIFGAAPFTVSAAADSGLSPTFSIVSGPATISGHTVTLTGAGTVVVRASQVGDSNYNAAADVDQGFIVAKASATVTLGSLSSTYNGSPHAATATTNPASLTVNFTYNGSTTAPTNSGSYTVVGTISDANYQGSNSGTLVIAKASATVTLGSLSSTYDGSAHAATATTNPVSLTVNFTYNGSTTAPTNSGSYAVVGTISDANYQGSTSGTLVIAKAAATVTLGNLSRTYNGSVRAATATTNPASLSVNFTYNGSTTAPTNSGSYAVVGTISDSNYQGSTSGTLIVSKATPVITWGNPFAISYGTALDGTQLNATAGTAGAFVYSPAAGTVLNAGTQILGTTFTPTDSANYTAATKSVNLTVNKAPLVVTANGTSRAYGAADPSFTVTISGFVNGDPASVVTGTPDFTTSATSASNVGSYRIYPAIGTLAANNYNLSLMLYGTLTITPAPLTVTADSKTKWLGAANPALTISYAGFVNGESTSSLTDQPVAGTTAVTGSPAGSYPITVAGGLATNYSLTYVGGTLTVNAAGFPLFTIQPVSQAMALGRSVTFSAVASGTPTPTYQWKKGGLNISGATGNAYTITSVTMGDIGSYSVVATNSVGGITSDSVVLTIIIAPSGAVISIAVE